MLNPELTSKELLWDPRQQCWVRPFWSTRTGWSVSAEILEGPNKGKWTTTPLALYLVPLTD